LEMAMEEASGSKYISSVFQQPFNEVTDNSGRLPLWFINTTQLEHGYPAVVSNIRLDSFTKRIDVLNLLEKENADCKKEKGFMNMHMSSAVILGAR
ncbi:hypothetical protein ACWTQZ_26115, partial [Escherichia coli]